MTHYLVQPRDRVFVKGYRFLLFAKNVGTKLSGKYCQKFSDHAKQSATDELINTLKRVIQKKADPTGGFIGNEITDRIKQISKTLQQNNSETVTNGHVKEISKERYTSLEER